MIEIDEHYRAKKKFHDSLIEFLKTIDSDVININISCKKSENNVSYKLSRDEKASFKI
jgi:hypothetical protein